MKRILCLAMLFIICLSGQAAWWEKARKVKNTAEKGYIYRFWLKDKQNNEYSIQHPIKFLSAKAIERRNRQGLAIDSTDLPVSSKYIRLFRQKGIKIAGTSKWNNTVLVYTADSTTLDQLKHLTCVKRWAQVWQTPDSVIPMAKRPKIHKDFNKWDSVMTSSYGAAKEQTETVNGIRLHQCGFMGKGKCIAVLDGGFENANIIPALSNANVVGARDFVIASPANIYNETDHGTRVFSAMAAWAPHVMKGTAPEASYWLLRCEDRQSEQPVEEDYWAMAAEFADSVGVDIINSSLGYTRFDNHADDHHYKDMDGHSTLISQTASMLAAKGIILVCSAGNKGMGPWKKLDFPADADSILTVGAITPQLENAPFSSVGPTQDGRIKPDVMAPGSPACLISGRGTLVQDMGTSFATPIVCGMVACLWQALPKLSAIQIIDLIRQSGNNRQHPDNVFGYGVPDFWHAYNEGLKGMSIKK